MIAAIAREVVRRLRDNHPSESPAPAATVFEKLITIETLGRYAESGEIHATARAIVTPAAREEAARRGIRIRHSGEHHWKPVPPTPTPTPPTATPPAGALEVQLARRGVAIPCGTEVVWTAEPASEVFRRCSRGERAVMISSLADVDRFACEFSPNVWVLDQLKLNLVAATNAAARIARLPQPGSQSPTGGSR